ncbi:hypothetical protein HUJ04_009892 [Dendroctonus ponderosae]|nr:hypothetical protein HUJ04_009892 [Dendroctonus ponderosae]
MKTNVYIYNMPVTLFSSVALFAEVEKQLEPGAVEVQRVEEGMSIIPRTLMANIWDIFGNSFNVRINTMASVFTLAIIGLFCSLFIPVWGCEVTFLNTKVTLGGARDVKNVTGCFSPTDEFIKVSYIQIINENVTALKRNAISGLPKLVDVIIDTSNITDLESGCFSDLPQLYLIKLRHNNFKTVREGVFNKLTLIELCLSNNSIETIHPKAFNDIPNLSILQLDQNKLSYWSGEWFLGSPKISVLNFEYNIITNLPTAALQNINGLHYDAQSHAYVYDGYTMVR